MLSVPYAEGTVVAGKYRVERVLGRGGMGVVLSAWHLELDQRVALKFLSEELAENADAAERFRREARAVARIKSEHVVRVLDVGILNEKVPYLVMEYLEGQDLEQELVQREKLPVSQAVDYLLQVIEAVAEAHAAGIVHRDLKPGNLFLLDRRDGTPMIKVLDFGISKALTGGSSPEQMSLTATASLIGSPLYMSPEQMQSPRRVDQRTDIWSLGAILYRMLAGQPPYPAETIAQLCSMVLSSTSAPLSEFRSDVPPELERIILRCLEKDLEKRIPNVSALANALARFGTELSQVHVSRAARILSIPGQDPVKRDGDRSSQHGGAEGGAGTQSAWHRDETKGGYRPLRAALFGVLLLAAAIGAAIAFWPRAVREEPIPASATTALNVSPIEPVQTVVVTPSAAVVPASTAESELRIPRAPAASTSAAPQAPPPNWVSPGRVAPAGPNGWGAQRPGALVPGPTQPRVDKVPIAKPVPPSNQPGGLTDFGGRR